MLTLTPPGQLANGIEQILVKVKDGASIYDRNGNPMGSGASTDSLTLYDKLPPGMIVYKLSIVMNMPTCIFLKVSTIQTLIPLGLGFLMIPLSLALEVMQPMFL